MKASVMRQEGAHQLSRGGLRQIQLETEPGGTVTGTSVSRAALGTRGRATRFWKP